jgi:hypothetical protein
MPQIAKKPAASKETANGAGCWLDQRKSVILAPATKKKEASRRVGGANEIQARKEEGDRKTDEEAGKREGRKEGRKEERKAANPVPSNAYIGRFKVLGQGRY